jgi:hypothetical protein
MDCRLRLKQYRRLGYKVQAAEKTAAKEAGEIHLLCRPYDERRSSCAL